MGGACSTHGEKRNVCRVLVGKPEGKRPLGRFRCERKNNIKVDLREIGWGGMGWINMSQNKRQRRALVNKAIKCWGNS
jgi:hypothetical protein